jgi:taurine dioxygenase
MSYQAEPLSPGHSFGALVTGLNVDELDDPQVRARLRRLWLDRGVLVIRGLPCDQETHVKLGECFGEVEEHPYNLGREGVLPQVVDVYAGEEDGDIYDLGDGDIRQGWLPWHFDLCYSDRINHGGILRAVSLPPEGGRTGFIDGLEAYASLPEALRTRVEDLSVIYEMEFDASRMRFTRPPGIRLLRQQARTLRFAGRAHELPRAIHPMVYREAHGDRPVLHVSPWFAAGIEGMETAEGDALLEQVFRHATDGALAYYHVWEPQDYVLWDNWRMMHSATGIPPGARRHLQRVALAGDYSLGRMEEPGARSAGAALVV